jgi:hypothetical protein
MTRLSVGLPALVGSIDKFPERFDLLELRPVDAAVPKGGNLRKWRKAVPPSFVFSVVLPKVVADLAPSAELDAALKTSLEVARTIEARCVVLTTPPTVRPTPTNKKRLAAVLEQIPKDGVVRCWEPSGLWEREEVIALARELGVLPVFDATRVAPAPGPIVYTRVRAVGTMGAAGVAKLAERLRRRREVFVVVEGVNEARRLRSSLAAEMAPRPTRAGVSVIVRPGAGTLVAEDEEQ